MLYPVIINQGPVSQKLFRAEMIVKSIIQTFLILKDVSPKHRNLRH